MAPPYATFLLLLIPAPAHGAASGYWISYQGSTDCGTNRQAAYELRPDWCTYVDPNVYIKATCASEHDAHGTFVQYSDSACSVLAYTHPTSCSASTFATPSNACNDWTSGTRLTSTSTSYRAPSCFRKSGASDSFQFWCTRPHYEAETSTAYWGLQSYHTFYVPSQNGGGDYREMIMMTPPNKGLGDSLTAAVLALYGRSVSRMTFAAQSCVLMADPYVSSMDAVVVCPKGKRNNNGELGWNSNGLPASTEGITTDDTVFIGLCLQFALHHFDVPEEKAFAIGFVSCRRFSNPLPGHTHRKTDPERFSAPR